MNDAHNLFEYSGCSTALARKDDPQTSKDAAEKIVKSGALNRQEKMVYEEIQGYYRNFGDFTTKDIAKWISLPNFIPYDKAYDICRKRFSGLERKGKIKLVKEKKNVTDCTFIYVDKRRDGCRVWRLVVD